MPCLAAEGVFLPETGAFLPLPKLATEPFLKLWEQEVFALLLQEGSGEANQLLLGKGDGTFQSPRPMSEAVTTVADFNGDGTLDLLTYRHPSLVLSGLAVRRPCMIQSNGRKRGR